MDPQSAKLIATSLCLLPLIAVALGLSWIFSTSLSSMARNPSVIKDVKGSTILYFAFTEAIGLFALVVALLILFVA